MAFSFRKMLSNITYFKRGQSESESEISGETGGIKRRHSSVADPSPPSQTSQAPFELAALDLSSRRYASSVKRISEPVKYFSARKNSLSDESPDSKKDRRESKKLRLDIDKANKSAAHSLEGDNRYANYLIENTPNQISLRAKGNICSDELVRDFDLERSLDSIFDFSDIESLPENSDSESSAPSDPEEKPQVKMCHKVSASKDNTERSVITKLHNSLSDDSFSDVESDRNEEERVTLLLSYQMKLEKMERLLKKLLTEFQFHIEVSKVFNCKSFLTTLPGSDISNLPKILGEITHVDNISRGASPTGSWNIVMEKEDTLAKLKLRKQLTSMKAFIEEFVDVYLQTPPRPNIQHVPSGNSTMADIEQKPTPQVLTDKPKPIRTIPRKIRINRRKYERRMNDFPDLREILHNLFMLDSERSMSINASVSVANVTSLMSDLEESNVSRCTCNCPIHTTDSIKSGDSGLPTKQSDEKSDTIASSIGDFTLDNSTLTAFSESLDQVLSYNSFDDSGLVSSMLQKSAIKRITFYVEVHSIQMGSEQSCDDSMGARITFACQACHCSDIADEQGLLAHILGQAHCEKIHFLYKTAYIKRCFATGEEIQPSTILNSMLLYRDDNKIVCFGDSKFACSLCFVSPIVGESKLIEHCYERGHVDKRSRLDEILGADA